MAGSNVYVRAKLPNGHWVSVDALCLTDESFKVFTLQRMVSAGIVAAVSGEYAEEEIDLEADPERIIKYAQQEE